MKKMNFSGGDLGKSYMNFQNEDYYTWGETYNKGGTTLAVGF